MENTPLIHLEKVNQSFQRDSLQDLLVLKDIDFEMRDEIVVFLGKSGSGKSTLLRIISGLIPPTSGQVLYRDNPVQGAVPGISMVFQSFALLPWLTVYENVEFGLQAQGVPAEERHPRVLAAIDMIGLDGFESAYPKELSGGMRQRVGLARALVVQPDVLLMDEPFSALDVLTADNLRSDLLDIWSSPERQLKGILLVTHNIEEAILFADRILIFDSNPGRIRAELKIDLPRPRQKQHPRFEHLMERVYTLMATKSITEIHPQLRGIRQKANDLGYRLPDIDISELAGLLETIHGDPYSGTVELPELADVLSLHVDDLFPLTEVLEILDLARVQGPVVELSMAGQQFSEADILERKKIFAQQLLTHIPLARHIRHQLDNEIAHRQNKELFIEELQDYLSDQEAERVLRIMIDWGRYAEIFAYDDKTGILSLENPG